jgi:hypothetical protein
VPETPRIFIYISCIGDESTTLVQWVCRFHIQADVYQQILAWKNGTLDTDKCMGTGVVVPVRWDTWQP